MFKFGFLVAQTAHPNPNHEPNMDWLLKLLKPLIGKNLPSLARSLVTALGGALVGHGLLAPENVQDGIQAGEIAQIVTGALLVWASRLTNWLRAKQLGGRSMDAVGEKLGALFGRSIHSLVRSAMSASAGLLASWGFIEAGTTGDQLGGMDLVPIISAVLLWAMGRFYSYLQEGKELGGIR